MTSFFATRALTLGTAACLLTIGDARAAEPLLSAQQMIDKGAQRMPAAAVKSMLGSGAVVETVAPGSGNLRQWTHGADGRFTVMRSPGSTELMARQGAWRVEEDGLYCIDLSWKAVDEKWCRAVYIVQGAHYLAPANLSKSADKRFGLVRLAGSERAPASASVASGDTASSRLPPGKIQMFYFGGNDCPPCVNWRGLELPKLQKSEAFRAIEFVYVQKAIKSPIPSPMFLPESVKPYKALLDFAGGGNNGSSQTAVIVDGEVFDFYGGTRSAEEIEARLRALRSGGRYPFERCVEIGQGTKQCVKRIAAS